MSNLTNDVLLHELKKMSPIEAYWVFMSTTNSPIAPQPPDTTHIELLDALAENPKQLYSLSFEVRIMCNAKQGIRNITRQATEHIANRNFFLLYRRTTVGYEIAAKRLCTLFTLCKETKQTDYFYERMKAMMERIAYAYPEEELYTLCADLSFCNVPRLLSHIVLPVLYQRNPLCGIEDFLLFYSKWHPRHTPLLLSAIKDYDTSRTKHN